MAPPTDRMNTCLSGFANDRTDGHGLGSVFGEDEIFGGSSGPRNDLYLARSVWEGTARNPIGGNPTGPCDSKDEPLAETPAPEDGAIGGNIFLNESIGFNLELDAGGGYSLSGLKRGGWEVVEGFWNRGRDGDWEGCEERDSAHENGCGLHFRGRDGGMT